MAEYREVKLVTELAESIERTHQIDFGMLRVPEREVYEFCANAVIDHFVNVHQRYINEQELQMLAQVTHNMVEAFVLNLQQNAKIIAVIKRDRKKKGNEE